MFKDGHWEIKLSAITVPGKSINFLNPAAAGTSNLGVLDSGSISIIGNAGAVANIIKLVPGYKLVNNEYRGTCGTFPDLEFTFEGSARKYTVSHNLLEVKTLAGDCVVLLNGVNGSKFSNFVLQSVWFARKDSSSSKYLVARGAFPSKRLFP